MAGVPLLAVVPPEQGVVQLPVVVPPEPVGFESPVGPIAWDGFELRVALSALVAEFAPLVRSGVRWGERFALPVASIVQPEHSGGWSQALVAR
jgi:hypothetical protein